MLEDLAELETERRLDDLTLDREDAELLETKDDDDETLVIAPELGGTKEVGAVDSLEEEAPQPIKAKHTVIHEKYIAGSNRKKYMKRVPPLN